MDCFVFKYTIPISNYETIVLEENLKPKVTFRIYQVLFYYWSYYTLVMTNSSSIV